MANTIGRKTKKGIELNPTPEGRKVLLDSLHDLQRRMLLDNSDEGIESIPCDYETYPIDPEEKG